jgi:hypothetical protein
MKNPAHFRFAALALALLVSACGKSEPPSDRAASPEPPADSADAHATEPASASDPGAAAADPSAGAATPVPPGFPQPLTPSPEGSVPAGASLAVSDLDAYVKGMQREIERLRVAVDQLAAARAAKDSAAETAAMMQLSSPEVRRAGAEAAGLPLARYSDIRDQIDQVLAAEDMGAAFKPQIEAAENADLSSYTEEQKAQHAKNLEELRAAFGSPYKDLSPEVAEAFEARHDELAALRAEALKAQLSPLQSG